jgi:outer membrane protein TolC
MIRTGLCRSLLAAFAIGMAGPATAAGLTLAAVLAHAEAPHPELAMAQARSEMAQAEAELGKSLNDFRLTLNATLQTGRNDYYHDRFHPDHLVKLNASKTLLDSGRQQAAVLAADQERQARGLQLLDVRAQRSLGLMARYFDVLLADMREMAETEALAVAYVNWDNAKDRQAVGQLAAWALTELEANYQDAVNRRNDVRRGLREKRMALGAAMNQPGMLLDVLADPALPGNERALPDFDALQTRMLATNQRLAAQKQRLAAASQRLHAARLENRPSLGFEAEAAAWSRDSSTRNDLRAGFNFAWPLWQGGGTDARIGLEQARFHELQAQHDALVQALQQSLLEATEEIQYLHATARRSAEMNATYRDQSLEKARAEYEMELKTNLGSSMAETQFAQIRKRAVEYRLALAWARLDALLGEAQPGLLALAAPNPAKEK